MAYSFVFIDDESIMRDSIKYMADWKNYDFKCVGTFSNSKETLDFLQKNHNKYF